MQKDKRLPSLIETDRLRLQLIRERDASFMQALLNTQGWIENIGDRNVHSKTDALAYIDRIKGMENLFYWVVRVKETGKPIGLVSFMKRVYLAHYDLGFAFLPDYSGLGFAFEAAGAVQVMAGRQPDFLTICATTIPKNESSIRLLIKLGFEFESELDIFNELLHVYSCQTHVILHEG
jgi:[ribosomal protein S5]-alanine N-acetyltransferase